MPNQTDKTPVKPGEPTRYEFIVQNVKTGDVVYRVFTLRQKNRSRLIAFLNKPLGDGATHLKRIAAATETGNRDWRWRGTRVADGIASGDWRGYWTGLTERQAPDTRITYPIPAADPEPQTAGMAK